MAHMVLFYSHSSGHMTRMNEERGGPLGCQARGQGVCVLACLCVSVCMYLCMYKHVRQVADFENVVGV